MKKSSQSERTAIDSVIHLFEPILKYVNVHRFLWGFTYVCALVAWNRGLMLLYGLVSFLLALLVVCHFFHWKNLRGLSVNSNFANEEIFANRRASFTLHLNSRTTQHFIHICLPIERIKQRHPSNKNIEQIAHQSRSFVLRSKGKKDFTQTVKLSRGVYCLQSVKLSSGYPLGILIKRKQDSFSSSELYVLPVWSSINEMPAAKSSQQGRGELISQAKGGQDDFTSIRPYRRGDAFKTVHWGASARQVSRGKDWMVKEFSSVDMPRILITLNQFQIQNDKMINTMISTALAVGECFAKKGYQVSLLGYDAFSESASDFWEIELTTQMNPDKLRKLAEIDSLQYMKFEYNDAMQAMISHLPNANIVTTFAPNTPNESNLSWQGSLAGKTHYCMRLGAEGEHRKISDFEYEYYVDSSAQFAR